MQQREPDEPATTGRRRAVEARDLHFDIERRDVRTWHPAGPLVSHLYNVWSLHFPAGEAFFVESVRYFEPRVADPRTRRELRGFLNQEGLHRREHQRYNEALAAAGLPAAYLAKRVANFLQWSRRILSPQSQLGLTIGLEHLTAILAAPVLRDERILATDDPGVARLWWWHAIEETEHKSVAFDVYAEVTAKQRGAYLRRVLTMTAISAVFATSTLTFLLVFARRDALLWDRRAWAQLWRFLAREPGVLRGVGRHYLDYFRRGFHPWQHDNAALAERWAAALLEARQKPASGSAPGALSNR